MSAFQDTIVSHEWLAPNGGSENVFEDLVQALPGSRPQCLWNDAPSRFGPEVKETWLANTPLRGRKAASLALHPLVWKTLDLRGVRRVVASSHAFAHHLASKAARQGLQGFAYVHTPARYIWEPTLDARGGSLAARTAARPLRLLDRKQIRPDVSYAANSEFVRDRIRRNWKTDARVIHPPVRVRQLQSEKHWVDTLDAEEQEKFAALPSEFVLGASRLVEYKRLDQAIRVGELIDMPVVIAGDGPLRPSLESWARLNYPQRVEFTGRVSDRFLYALYQAARLFVFLPVEDFGIMPVEAMSLGTPVIANPTGGARESVSAVSGGYLVSPEAADGALREAAAAALGLDRSGIALRALAFDEVKFRENVRAWVTG